MCGIAGFIGKSKYPDVSHALLTSLFQRLEERGTDASGFWGTEPGNGRILYHKEPIKASEFVKREIWQNVGDLDTNLMLVHARGASQGAGHPFTNKNNHPFVSSDKSIGLIHNGRIPDIEYDALKKKYEVKSDCDSEILLRIFEATEESQDNFEEFNSPDEMQIAHRIRSLRNIWSQIVKGHMAVAIGERLDESNRRLWFFRNRFRSIWIVDMRKYLGQFFFCSTPEIWQAAAFACREVRPFIRKRIKLIELPPEEIWVFRVSEETPVVETSQVRKFNVLPQGFHSFEYAGEPLPVSEGKPVSEVYTRLDENDVVNRQEFPVKKNIIVRHEHTNLHSRRTCIPPQVGTAHRTISDGSYSPTVGSKATPLLPLQIPPVRGQAAYNPKSNEEMRQMNSPMNPSNNGIDLFKGTDDVKDFEDFSKGVEIEEKFEVQDVIGKCKELNEIIARIETSALNMRMEGSLTRLSFGELMTSLDQASLDLKGTLRILDS